MSLPEQATRRAWARAVLEAARPGWRVGRCTPGSACRAARARVAGQPPLRLLLDDDDVLVRCGLRVIFGSDPDLTVVGDAGTGREALDVAASTDPDVVLMDVRMPDMDGIAATAELVIGGLEPRPSRSGTPPSVTSRPAGGCATRSFRTFRRAFSSSAMASAASTRCTARA